MTLAGRTAVVTGGGRGIGAATAAALAEAGARVCVTARTGEEVFEVAASLRSRGFEAIAFPCDVTQPDQVKEILASVAAAMGRIDILVNNAGTATSAPIGRISLEEWNRVMAVNATGTFVCTQAVFDGMIGNGWGRIVNVASIAGLEGERYIAAYAAAKHAVVGFTRSAAAEAAGTGVTVNAVCPGYVDTPLTEQTIRRVMDVTDLSRDDALDAILRKAGQARLIRAEEVATVIVGLCADEAGERNGEAVLVEVATER